MNIMIIAMGRSGYHAIATWICRNLLGNVLYCNNCTNGWDNKEFDPKKGNMGQKLYENTDSNEWNNVYSLEDFYLPLWKEYDMSNFIPRFDFIVMVVRNIDDWLSSSIACGDWANEYLDKSPENEIELPVTRIDAYKKFLEFKTKNRKETGFLYENVITVSYDEWVKDDDCKKGLAQFIGFDIKYMDQPYCKFSSFYGKGRFENYKNDYFDRIKLLKKKDLARYYELKGKFF